MRLQVRRFQEGDVEAIRRLNRRLEAGHSTHRLFEEGSASQSTGGEDQPVTDSLFVAADGDEIRGGAWLREEDFWVAGARERVGWMKYPVAESLVDPQYAGVPASMLFQFFRQQPRLMAVGMGGHDGAFARLLAGVGWSSSTIPFLFRIVRPFRVLRLLRYARQRRWLRTAMDLAAWSGLGWLGHRLLLATAPRAPWTSDVLATVEPRFSPWADAIWETCRGAYRALAVRDAKALDWVNPAGMPDLDRLRVARAGADIGWACTQILPSSPESEKYFGGLRVGLITDVLAMPSEAGAVLAAAVRHLEGCGADLVITYLSHPAWVRAARRLRFLSGPSTLAFYASPGAQKLLAAAEPLSTGLHFTRSDGHGPQGSLRFQVPVASG